MMQHDQQDASYLQINTKAGFHLFLLPDKHINMSYNTHMKLT